MEILGKIYHVIYWMLAGDGAMSSNPAINVGFWGVIAPTMAAIILFSVIGTTLWVLSWPFRPFIWAYDRAQSRRAVLAEATKAEAKAQAIRDAKAKADHDRWWTSRGMVPPKRVH